MVLLYDIQGERNMSEKTALWKKVEKTDQQYLKDVTFGSHKFKSIDAQYQLLKATTEWGPYGSSWGVKNESFTPIMTGDNSVASILYNATLYYPDGEFPINSDIRLNTKTKNGYVENKDWAKKVSTDAFTKGLSKLGFSADVFMGGYDGNKYDSIESFEDNPITESQKEHLNRYIEALRKNGFSGEADRMKIMADSARFTSDYKKAVKGAIFYLKMEVK